MATCLLQINETEKKHNVHKTVTFQKCLEKLYIFDKIISYLNKNNCAGGLFNYLNL